MTDQLIVFEGGRIGSATSGTQTFLQKCKQLFAAQPIKWPRANAEGKPHSDIANLGHFLKWSGVQVVYDVFSRRYLAKGLPCAFELDDEAIRDVRLTMGIFNFEVSKETFKEWIFYLAQQYRLHPVERYLDSLHWDGISRIDAWLTDYCGVAENPYSRAVARLFLIAAVRRIRQPGAKFDTMLVLEGKQGQGKSSIPKVLASELWFTDDMKMGLDSKEVIEKTAGKWIVEIAELHGMSNKEIEAVKSFISRQQEVARGAYRATASTIPREFVLIGTTNDRRYLKDPTGNRRFLPIWVPGTPGSIDLVGLANVRDQLWAEAAAREAEGATITLPEELWEAAAVEQQARVITDPKAERLMDFLEDCEGFVATEELYQALELDPQHREQRHQSLISSTMQALGWEHLPSAHTVKDGDTVIYRHRGWKKGETWRDCVLLLEDGRFAAVDVVSLRQRMRSAI